uniref:Nascent polypeptide-associated complex subunit alpha-like UBA domain-containing protein n=1 Tax=Plectus sambesii TaxID=2011161 RepID=A0A914UR19_9BILA
MSDSLKTENDTPVDEEDEASQKNPHKHNSGQADLEKVTDFAEDKELRISSDVGTLIGNTGSEDTAKLTIRKEDVDLIMRELEVPRVKAERKLREHRGNAKAAMKDLLGFA